MAAVRGAELLIRLINIFILSHTHTHQYQTDKPYCFLKLSTCELDYLNM